MNKVLIYDGKCNMCSTFINLLVHFNISKNLFFTDFESKWSAQHLPSIFQNKQSIIYVKDNKYYYYSDAIFHCMADMNPIFKPILVFKLIRHQSRDKLYKFVSKHRHSIVKNKCTLPPQKFWEMYLK